ncbi:SDR family oxidoreductase [uncultured Gimesia sp.]|uniref:SDR family oxidoreductase n=1 Tax=uncultured Gimesia sp. TaxID=1678688 RepID=UPI0030DD3F8E
MAQSLVGKTAVITGGSRGYGAGIAKILKEAGADVWITGRDPVSLNKTAQLLGVKHLAADVVIPDDWDVLIQRVLADTGKLDILVNNAGSAVRIKPLDEQTDKEIIESIQVNLIGTMLGCRRAASTMRKQNSGMIINISSICQQFAWPGWAAYSAAKAGVAQMSRCLYAELRAHGIRVTTVVPSWGATDFTSTTEDLADAPASDPLIHQQCIQPDELGEVVAHICTLPSHLEVLEYTLLPRVQEIIPL